MTEPISPSQPPSQGSGRSRQAIGLWVGAGLGIVVVAIVLLVTLTSGNSETAATSTTAPAGATQTTIKLPPELLAPVEVPDGDYGDFCTELLAQTDSFSSQTGIEQLRTLFQELDFDRLIPVAPEGLRPSLTVLRDSQDAARVALEQIDSVDQLDAADFPEGFLSAFAQVGRAYGEKCPKPAGA